MDLEKTIGQINRFYDLQSQKLSYHEVAHVLISYSIGVSCSFINCGFDIKVKEVRGYLEIDAESRSMVLHDLPNWLMKVLDLMQLNYPMNTIQKLTGVTFEEINTYLKKYAQILVAGAVGETYYKSLRLWWLKKQVMRYGVNLSVAPLLTDQGRLDMIASYIKLEIPQYEKNVRTLLKSAENKTILKKFAMEAYRKRRIDRKEIERFLNTNGFRPIPFQL